MNNSDRNHTLEQLQQRGLLDANKMAAAVNSDGTDHNNTNDTPWFIHLFLVLVASWRAYSSLDF